MQSPCPVKGIENITKVIQASSRADHDIPVFAMTANFSPMIAAAAARQG